MPDTVSFLSGTKMVQNFVLRRKEIRYKRNKAQSKNFGREEKSRRKSDYRIGSVKICIGLFFAIIPSHLPLCIMHGPKIAGNQNTGQFSSVRYFLFYSAPGKRRKTSGAKIPGGGKNFRGNQPGKRRKYAPVGIPGKARVFLPVAYERPRSRLAFPAKTRRFSSSVRSESRSTPPT